MAVKKTKIACLEKITRPSVALPDGHFQVLNSRKRSGKKKAELEDFFLFCFLKKTCTEKALQTSIMKLAYCRFQCSVFSLWMNCLRHVFVCRRVKLRQLKWLCDLKDVQHQHRMGTFTDDVGVVSDFAGSLQKRRETLNWNATSCARKEKGKKLHCLSL